MNIINTNKAACLAVTAEMTSLLIHKVRSWRRERANEGLHQISGAAIIASLREDISNDAWFLVSFEFGWLHVRQRQAQSLPTRKWGPRQRRRTPFYRWHSNPVRNPEPVAAQ